MNEGMNERMIYFIKYFLLSIFHIEYLFYFREEWKIVEDNVNGVAVWYIESIAWHTFINNENLKNVTTNVSNKGPSQRFYPDAIFEDQVIDITEKSFEGEFSLRTFWSTYLCADLESRVSAQQKTKALCSNL